MTILTSFYSSALESPNAHTSPSLYEGAFRLETTARPSDMFSAGLHATMLIGSCKGENIHDEDSPMSSPVDESYKIRIGPRGSSSPASHDGEDCKPELEEDGEAQDLTVSLNHLQDEAMDEDKTKMNLYEDEDASLHWKTQFSKFVSGQTKPLPTIRSLSLEPRISLWSLESGYL